MFNVKHFSYYKNSLFARVVSDIQQELTYITDIQTLSLVLYIETVLSYILKAFYTHDDGISTCVPVLEESPNECQYTIAEPSYSNSCKKTTTEVIFERDYVK